MLTTLALVACASAPMTDWFVDDDAQGPGTGTMADPYSTIQAAVDAATTLDGDTIIVLDGIYRESVFIDAKRVNIHASPAAAVTVERTASDETALTIRAISSPGISIRGITFADGSSSSSGDGCAVDLLAADVTLEDCHITGNRGDGFLPAGIRVAGGSLQMTDCTVERNDGGQFAGGLGAFGNSRVTIDSTVFDRNPPSFAAADGGGIYFNGAELTVRDSTFTRNNAFAGSGIKIASGTALIQGSDFVSNGDGFSNQQGGALDGAGTIERCTFVQNTARDGGAVRGIWVIRHSGFDGNTGADGEDWATAVAGLQATEMTDCVIQNHRGITFSTNQPCSSVVGATLLRCRFENNQVFRASIPGTAFSGGAITDCVATECRFYSNGAFGNSSAGVSPSRGGAALDSVLTRCEFFDNFADRGAAAYGCELQQCTVVLNSTLQGIDGAVSDSQLNSCIVYDNGGPSLANSSAIYSCIEGGAPGVGNIDQDPILRSPPASDYRLTAGSPCISTGDPVLPSSTGMTVDMGAVPFDPNDPGGSGAFCPSGPDGAGCSASLEATLQPSLSGGLQAIASDMRSTSVSVIFMGFAPSSPPYFNGTLCLGGALARGSIGLQTASGAGCSNEYTFDVPGARLLSAGFVPGDLLYAQAFYRDSSGGAATIGVTGAMVSVVQQ